MFGPFQRRVEDFFFFEFFKLSNFSVFHLHLKKKVRGHLWRRKKTRFLAVFLGLHCIHSDFFFLNKCYSENNPSISPKKARTVGASMDLHTFF